MSYVAHQYSRVGFYSFVEVNLSLYYGGVFIDQHASDYYVGTVKRYNVCKRHVAIDTDVKQTEYT